MLSKQVLIKYTLDSRTAKRGLDEFRKSTDDVRKSTREATDSVRDFERAIDRANRNQAAASRAMRDTSSSAGGLTGGLQSLVGSLGGPAGVAAAAVGTGIAIAELGSKVNDLAARSLQLTAVFANVPIPIEAARRQTQGLVTDFDLARLASDAVSLRITENAKEFADLSEALQKLGARRGVDALKSIEDGFSAIGRNSTELLDNLGITLKVAEAQDEYARSLGKAKNELTDVEKAEAFREVATRKIIDAARGVTIDTDSAAAAVRRFNVELQNIEDRALGGSVATLSLADGLRQIQAESPVNIKAIKDYGVEAANLRFALQDAGVASQDIPSDINELAKAARSAALDVRRLRQEEDERTKAREKDPAFRAEQARVAAEKESLETARLRITEIENEQAFLSANNDRIAEKASLQIESLQLQALIVRATGDESRARELERQAELAQLRELSRIANESTTRRRGGGRRRDPFIQERLEFQRQLTEAINAERQREFSQAATLQRGYLADVRRFQEELQVVRLSEFDRSAGLVEQRERLNQLQQAEIQRSVELAQVRGQSVEAYALEQQVFDLREQSLQRQLELETQVGERERIQGELSQVEHERTIARLNEERRVREGNQEAIANAINSVAAAERGAFALSSTIAAGTIAGEQRKKRVLDGIKAAGLVADGAVAAAQAVIAGASGNIPQAIALGAAAANAFAQAGLIAAGNARGGGGGGGGGAGSATQFGGGQPPPERARFELERGAPLSVREQVEANPNNTGGGTSGRQDAGRVNIGTINVNGSVDEEFTRKLAKELDSYSRRRV